MPLDLSSVIVELLSLPSDVNPYQVASSPP